MKRFPILVGFLVAPIGMSNAKIYHAASLQQLEDRTFNKEIAVIYFHEKVKNSERTQNVEKNKNQYEMIKKLARNKRYNYAQIPFISVNMKCEDEGRFKEFYRLNEQEPSIVIFKKGRPMPGARLDGYHSEDAIKNLIQNYVASDIDGLVEKRDEYEKQNASCPTWVHDWYFYWPYHYYGYHHPYYWHDGFHISFGC